ncbi:1713_t:CDS:2 [Cetraspora pellucida]|uniref:1713_t:CDS:1 n=1 Tax=Cetraspora pellucida TaxID=1433469 RepID=A0A9N9GN17_9GLOM|nr:1713_t:CDS:2 [Cetraspora pellucida]
MTSSNPSKRPRLSEVAQSDSHLEENHQHLQLHSQQFQVNNLQNNIPKQLYQHNPVIVNFPSPQQQSFPTSSDNMDSLLPSSDLDNKHEEPLTKHDLQRLEKVIDLMFPDKSAAAKEAATKLLNSSTIQIQSSSSRDDNTTSVVLDFPIIPEQATETEQIMSPLGYLLNHTYPNSIVELVSKLNKMSINPANLDFFNPNSNPSFTPTNNPPFTDPSAKSSGPPTKELCKQLINDYFTKFNIIIPILNRRKFMNHFGDKTKHSELLVNATLAAAAARYSDDPSIRKTPNKPGGVFFDSAKRLLDLVYDTPRLETVQSLILLSHAEVSVSRMNSASMFLGMAVQMAHALHLERDDISLPLEEDEERRRVFYCIYCCERWASFILGKPSCIDDTNINVPLPTMMSFNILTRSFFIAWIKLSRILGQIWKFGYSSQPKAFRANWLDHATDQKSLLRQIRSTLAKWLKELPDELQYQYLINNDQQGHIQLTTFSTFAAQAYRDPKIEKRKQGPNGPIKTCITAALTITDISKTTQKYNKEAFCTFQYPIYGLLQSTILELDIANGNRGYESGAKRFINDSIEELRFAAENSKFTFLQEMVKELEGVMMIANGRSSDIVIPFPIVLQMLESRSSCGLSNSNNNFANNGCVNFGKPFGLSKPSNNYKSPGSVSSNLSDDDSKMVEPPKVEYTSTEQTPEHPAINRSPPVTLLTETNRSPSVNLLTEKLAPASMSSPINYHQQHPPTTHQQQTNPDVYMMSPDYQDQTSLQFNQPQSNIGHHILSNPTAPWDQPPFFMDSEIYGFVNAHNYMLGVSQITDNSSETNGSLIDDLTGLYSIMKDVDGTNSTSL